MSFLDRIRTRVAELMMPAAADSVHPDVNERLWSDNDSFFVDTSSGIKVNPAIARQSTVGNACIRLLSTTVAMRPCGVYQVDGEATTRAVDDPLDRILRFRPNHYQSPFEFKLGLVASLAAHGNAFAEKRFGRSTGLQELWPIEPGNITVDWLNRKSGRRRVYDVHTSINGDRARTLPASRVWHPRLMSLNDGLTGASPIQLNAEGIGVAIAAQKYAGAFFSNGARAAGFLSPEAGANPKQVESLEETLNKKKAGLRHALKWQVFAVPMRFHSMGLSPKDAELAHIMGWSVEDLARIWGVPLWLLQHGQKDSNFGTGLEQQRTGFDVFTVAGYTCLLEDSARATFYEDPRSREVRFEMDAILRADIKTMYEALSLAVNGNNPWMTRNEARKIAGKEPDTGPDGDKFMPAVNNVGPRPGNDRPGAGAIITPEQYHREHANV